MNLEDIGFYTLSDHRAKYSSERTRLERCEMLLTKRCNFNCPYCRHVGPEETSLQEATRVVSYWCSEGCRNMRFSGGEPTLWENLPFLVGFARLHEGVEHVALSTNGSASLDAYKVLLDAGANDFSISLDACCASKAGKMMGVNGEQVRHVMDMIRFLASRTYVTIGTVLLPTNIPEVKDILDFAMDAGVADVRITPAAQWLPILDLKMEQKYLDRFPILRYRYNNMRNGESVRGLSPSDSEQCRLVLDDMVVSGGKHYPCIIHLREGGAPIGEIGSTTREDRAKWVSSHVPFLDPICRKNCLDVCRQYNQTADPEWCRRNSTARVSIGCCGKAAP